MRNKNFEVILILAELKNIKSLTKKMMPYEMSLIKKLKMAAKQAGVKLTVVSPFVSAPSENGARDFLAPPKPIYIHSKVLIVDDRFLCIGSANFADRALRVDTELHLTLEAKDEIERIHIRKVAKQILDHWGINASRSTHHAGGIFLRPFLPALEQSYLQKGLEGNRKIPIELIFDPQSPWFYPLQTKLRQFIRKRKNLFTYGLLILSLWVTLFLAMTQGLFHISKDPIYLLLVAPFIFLAGKISLYLWKNAD
jgi:hypothetical protein